MENNMKNAVSKQKLRSKKWRKNISLAQLILLFIFFSHFYLCLHQSMTMTTDCQASIINFRDFFCSLCVCDNIEISRLSHFKSSLITPSLLACHFERIEHEKGKKISSVVFNERLFRIHLNEKQLRQALV